MPDQSALIGKIMFDPEFEVRVEIVDTTGMVEDSKPVVLARVKYLESHPEGYNPGDLRWLRLTKLREKANV